MATKQKTIKADNARIFFTLTHCQFFNGVIPAHIYVERLVKLRSLISSGTALYQILSDILDELPIKLPKEEHCKIVELGKNYKISEVSQKEIERIAQQNGGMLSFTLIFHATDTDPLPSIPHLHDEENKCKIDVYTGKRYSLNNTYTNTKIDKKELIDFWNKDENFKKLKKNIEIFKHRIK